MKLSSRRVKLTLLKKNDMTRCTRLELHFLLSSYFNILNIYNLELYTLHKPINHNKCQYTRKMPVVSEGYPQYVDQKWAELNGKVEGAFTDYDNARTFFFVNDEKS